jgi:hypothetical protein
MIEVVLGSRRAAPCLTSPAAMFFPNHTPRIATCAPGLDLVVVPSMHNNPKIFFFKSTAKGVVQNCLDSYAGCWPDAGWSYEISSHA